MSINGLVFYYDGTEFKFRSRKEHISLASIVDDIDQNQFHEYPLPANRDNKLYRYCLDRRCTWMEKRGWKWVNKGK